MTQTAHRIRSSIIFNTDARTKLLRGVDTAADAIGATLGPGGRLVYIQRPGDASSFTKDGVSVATTVHLDDDVEDLGAEAVRRACAASVKATGDGTTTTAILLQAIVKEGSKLIAAGYEPTAIKKQLESGLDLVLKHLKASSIPTSGINDLRRVALVSANGDETIAHLASRAVDAVGVDGIVHVEGGKANACEVQSGFSFARGLAKSEFAAAAGSLELRDVLVAVSLVPLRTARDVVALINVAKKETKPLVIVGAVTAEALATCETNGVTVVADAPRDALEDLAVAVGATLIDPERHRADKLTLDLLGDVDHFAASMSRSAFVGGKAKPDVLARHLGVLDAADQKERAQNLRGRIAKITLVASTPAAWSEARDRIDDAVGSCRAALRDGLLPGGGTALALASRAVDGVLAHALTAPLKKIVSNAGGNADLVLGRVLDPERVGGWYGYDARANTYGNVGEMGIVDPTAVVIASITNAVSFGVLLLMTAATITEAEPE
jgi:chaperonin GroEL